MERGRLLPSGAAPMDTVGPKQHDRHEQSNVDQRKGEPRILVTDRLAEGDTVLFLLSCWSTDRAG